MKKKKAGIYGRLFLSTFSLSAFTLGGGFVIVPLMKRKFCDQLHWLEEEEMLNLAAIAQSSPGAVAVNAAVLAGYRIAGIPGALVAVLGTVLPPLIILSVVSLFYAAIRDNLLVAAVLKGMQAGVVAVIADVAWSMGGGVFRSRDFLSIAILLGAFAATALLHVNVVFIILICGLLGGLRALMAHHRKRKGGDTA